MDIYIKKIIKFYYYSWTFYSILILPYKYTDIMGMKKRKMIVIKKSGIEGKAEMKL